MNGTPRTRFWLLTLLVALISAWSFGVPDAQAATITVTTTTDELNSDGDCSLREAIRAANLDQAVSGCAPGSGPDTISVPAGTYTLSSALGRLEITSSINLNGADATTTIISGGNTVGPIVYVQYNELLVCDSSNDRVLRFNTATGAAAGTFISSGSGGLDLPGAITWGSDGRAYVAGFSSGVQRYSGTSGSFVDTFVASGSGGLLGPTDLVFGPGGGGASDPDTNLYVTKYQPNGAVLRYDRTSGAFLSTFASSGSGGAAITPNSIVFGGPSKDLFLTDTQGGGVLRYDGNTGAFMGTFVAPFSGGLDLPRGLAFGPDGNLYVASEDNDRILRYNGSTGAFIDTFVAAGSGGLDRPTDFAFGSDGFLYVISRGTNQVLRYDADTGAFIDIAIAAGAGGLGLPGCVTLVTGLGSAPTVNISRVTIRDGASSGINVAPEAYLGLYDSIVTENTALTGGGIVNNGQMDIRNTTVSDNEGGARAGGIANTSSGSMNIANSTISGNHATGGGGMVNSGRLDMINTTISGNTAEIRGGGMTNTNVAHIASSTITGNNVVRNEGSPSDLAGGGVYNGSGGLFQFWNTIIAGNTDNRVGSAASPDCFGTLDTERNNIVGNATNCTIDDGFADGTPFDQIGTASSPINPQLGPLANNGGPTRTHAITPGSPAIDRGSAAAVGQLFACDDQDQRGQLRPRDGNADGTARCDVGAYEYQPGGSSPTPLPTPGPGTSSKLHLPLMQR